MHRISALISGLTFAAACSAIAEPPRYTIQPLAITPTSNVVLRELGEGNTVLGQSSIGIFLWTDGVFRFAPSVIGSPVIEVMLPGNVAGGARWVGVSGSHYPIVFDGTAITELPATTPPGWIPEGRIIDGLSPTHLVGNDASRGAQWIDGVLSHLPLPEGCDAATAVGANSAGIILGYTGTCHPESFWLYADGKTTTHPWPAPIAPPAGGFIRYYDAPLDISDAGMILAARRYVVEINVGDEISVHNTLIFDGKTWHEYPYNARELTNAGQVFMTDRESSYCRSRTFVWDDGDVRLLEALIDGNLQDTRLIDAHPDGRVLVLLTGAGLPETYAVLVPQTQEPPVCRVDWDGNGVVNSADVGEYINSWFANQATGECP